ncbi:unnamed protein product [Pleuronectes platessa]|uniref:Uncharacterized protein n=1 Tax=Pleuronectes platessa TaxID=8262 RepID=A0A9N7UT44_PLEPL|nr:unnamed protein product [Pleuronectes platessa]
MLLSPSHLVVSCPLPPPNGRWQQRWRHNGTQTWRQRIPPQQHTITSESLIRKRDFRRKGQDRTEHALQRKSRAESGRQRLTWWRQTGGMKSRRRLGQNSRFLYGEQMAKER